MAISLVGSAFANSSGTGTSTTPTWTRPAGIPATDSYEVVFVVNNQIAATLTATGWTVTGPATTANGRAWCLTRAVSSSDSSTTPTVTLNANNRWAVSGGVWTGVAGSDGVQSATDDTAGISTLTLAAFTPLSANCVAVAGATGSRAIANANGITTVPAGYGSVLASAVTNEASANNYESAVMAKQLGANALNPSIAGAWTGNTRDMTFVVTLTPLTTTAAPTDTASGSALSTTLSVAVTTVPAETGSGADALATTATLSDGDTGSGADAATVLAHVTGADTGAGADGLTADATTAPADTGAGAEAFTTAATAAPAETGGAADSLTVAVAVPPAADTGTGGDSLGLGVLFTTEIAQSPGLAQAVTVAATIHPDEVAAAADGLTVVATLALADTGAGDDEAGTDTAPDTPQLDDEATGDDELTVVVSDLIQIFRGMSGHDADTVNPPLQYGEPLWDGGAIRVGPTAGGNAADQPRTQMGGAGTVRTITATGPILKADWVLLCNGASITTTLPAPGTVPGWRYYVKDIHATSLIVATAGGNIDGSSTATLTTGQSAMFVSDGTNWYAF